MVEPFRLAVSCAFGLEAVVRRELEALGVQEIISTDGRLEFDGRLSDIPRLNLRLRCADRVSIRLGEFLARDFGELFDGVRGLPWEDWLPFDARIDVDAKSVRSRLESVRTVQSISKKAVIERLRAHLHADHFPETGTPFTIQAAIHKDNAILTLDTSGLGLHKRGYRQGAGEVPLRENLAAALVSLSFFRPGRLLLDPMCGSGTILVEAAMLARRIAPGLNREFASERWPVLPAGLWAQERERARAEVLPSSAGVICGFDIDPERVRDTRENARRAGVGEDVRASVHDARSLDSAEIFAAEFGMIITNPPYGIKLGEASQLPPLYRGLDAALSRRPGWSLYVLTADRSFPDHFYRARPDRVRKLYNGTIETAYYQYYGQRPPREAELV